MPLIKAEGNLLNSEARGLVNAVNCVGVAGAGLARQFKDRWPQQVAEYTAFCEARKMQPGVIHDALLPDGRRILSVPTKKHWRNWSHLTIVSAGLSSLRRYMDETGLESVAVPALGCGLGGLPEGEVARLVEDLLGDSPAAVHVYGLDIKEG
jgi:O-acetyl-ADP-ribose deacetylase (regulator of RNase III)